MDVSVTDNAYYTVFLAVTHTERCQDWSNERPTVGMSFLDNPDNNRYVILQKYSGFIHYPD